MDGFNWIGESLDTFFSLLGKIGRWYNVRGKRICFIIWSVGLIYWIVRDFYLHLFSQGCFCFVSLILNAYGFYTWKKKGIS